MEGRRGESEEDEALSPARSRLAEQLCGRTAHFYDTVEQVAERSRRTGRVAPRPPPRPVGLLASRAL